MSEYFGTAYGWRWLWRDKSNKKQGFAVERCAQIEGRGSVLRVWSYRRGIDGPPSHVELYLSEGGQSLRVFRDGKELEAGA